MTAIEATDLRKHYGPVTALDGVSFRVEHGEVIGLLGPNGAGKTTLMKVLTGYLQPDEGRALVGGHDVVADPVAVQRGIGYLPESAPLYGEMSVQEYLLMIAALRGVAPGELSRRFTDAVLATGIESVLVRPIGQLSKGFRQRVGIAQAILHRPRLLILDEPTTGLDPAQIVEIRALVRELARDATVLLSTHILPEVELSCARVLIIMRGQLRADASLDELRASNAAVVAVAEDASDVEPALRGLSGVEGVDGLDRSDGYRRFRVRGRAGVDLCPAVFELVRARGWRIAELRRQSRTLEDVFNELARAESGAPVAAVTSAEARA